MSVFEKFKHNYEDYILVREQIKIAEKELEEIITAVSERLEMERTQTAARIEDLKGTCEDVTRSETVRNIAKLELQRLNGLSFFVMPEEIAAFEAKLDLLESAIKDAVDIKNKIKTSIDEINDAVKEMRTETLGKHDDELLIRKVEGCRSKFAKLCTPGV